MLTDVGGDGTADSRRILGSDSIAVEYTANGYQADDDAYSVGVVVDDPAMSQGILDNDFTEETKSNTLLYVGVGVLALIIIGAIVAFLCCNKGGEEEDESEMHHSEDNKANLEMKRKDSFDHDTEEH